MSDTKFEVGQRVVLVSGSNLKTYNEYEDDDTTDRGTIKSIDADGKVLVKWDGSYRKPNPGKHNADELITEVAADEILSKLEAEFEVWADPIRKKMQQAGKLIKEAGKMTEKQGRELTEMSRLTEPLIIAMGQVGWQTSSLSC